MPERERNRRLVEVNMLQIGHMQKILMAFEEMLESSRERLIDTYETLKRAKLAERGEKDLLPNWVKTDQKGPVIRPDAEKLALELRDYAGRVRDHKAQQIFLKMAEDYEQLAGKPEDCNIARTLPASSVSAAGRKPARP